MAVQDNEPRRGDLAVRRDPAPAGAPAGARPEPSACRGGEAEPEAVDEPEAVAEPVAADDPSLRVRRRVLVALCVLLVGVGLAVVWHRIPALLEWAGDPQAVRSFVESTGVSSRLVMVLVNAVQIVLAFVPGEPIELACGYAFGFWEGTLLCLLASAAASSAVFWVVRRWGWRVVGLFFDRSQLERFSWLRDSRRVELLMLVVFLIPGTPKDFLTYFAGLTGVRYPALLAIVTLGRIPSIVTSTMAASAVGSGSWGLAVGVGLAAVALALAGGVAYARLQRRSAGD